MTKETEVLVFRRCNSGNKVKIHSFFFFNLGHNVDAVIMRKESSNNNLNSMTLVADVQVRDFIRFIYIVKINFSILNLLSLPGAKNRLTEYITLVSKKDMPSPWSPRQEF